MKRIVMVVIEKDIEVELMPSMFGPMTKAEYIAEFSKYLWDIDSLDDVIKYAARVAADGGIGGNHDGLGLVDHYFSDYPRVPDVKIRTISEEIETEIIEEYP